MSTIRARLQIVGCFLSLQYLSAQFPCTISQQVFQVTHKLVYKPERMGSESVMLQKQNKGQ